MITINKNPSRKQLRWFAGLWLPLFGAALGSMLFWRAHAPTAAMTVWSAAAIATVGSLLSAAVARAVFLGLSYATFPIGFVMSWVALALLYFLVLTPFAFVMRSAGRDLLHLAPDTDSGSYWTPRPGRDSESSRAFRQF